MHFVTGGAFNGKKAWVVERYQLNENVRWISSYKNHPLPHQISDSQEDTLVLEGIERWVKEASAEYDSQKTREMFRLHLTDWLQWENFQSNRQLILIGTDITKGIVPMEKGNRVWRDITGWIYQDIAKRAEHVDVIWYGINQRLK